MHKKILLYTFILFSSFNVSAAIIDLEGQEADGAGFNIFEFDNANSNEVLSVDFVFNYEAFSPSYGAEMIVEVGHLPSGTFIQIGTEDFSCFDFGVLCEVDLGLSADPGIYSVSGSFALDAGAILDGSGIWQILIADSFDDSGVDGQFLAGSFVEIIQRPTVVEQPVPAPALFSMIMLGMFFVCRKHKR